jgi:cell division protein FtsQ
MSTRKPARKQPGNRRVSSPRQRKHQYILDVKLRSRTASRQRNRKVLTWFSTLLLICAVVGGIAYGGWIALRRLLWQNPEYRLAEVDVHTDGSLTREQIVDAANIHLGENIFSVTLSAAHRGLMTLPLVETADIERTLPNRISIDITERKPVAWVTGKDDSNPSADPGAYLIDRGGTLVRIKGDVSRYYHLPVISGLDIDNYVEGQTVDLPEVSAALELIRLTGENPDRYQVRDIDVSLGYCLVVTDERHARVTFPLEDLQAQLSRLALVYANVDAAHQEIDTVNLLVQRNIPVTFVQPAGPDLNPDAEAAPEPAIALPSPAAGAKKLPSTKKTTIKRALPVHQDGDPHDDLPVRRAIPVYGPSAQT